MDGQKSVTKLTRTQSSLLRSSPTIRSSIHSLSSIADDEEIASDEEKPHHKTVSKTRKPVLYPYRTNRFVSVLTVTTLTFSTLFIIFNFTRKDETPTSENILLFLIIVAVLVFFAGKQKGLIFKTLKFIKRVCEERQSKKSKPIQWFIGDLSETKESRTIREGVEIYSNGDYYEGEFHKGKCNGSGVYNYFVNGRYEGDWIEGRYDGYGVESWTRGSRYRGQYRQGLRHGYGVYRFYTGDTYAGEWVNGQSHGVGVQSCSDGSCYVGVFKAGVKHGLGCYHFRNGDRYAGEYFGDKIHGFGVYHFANGHYYEGSWHEGRKQGYGSYTFRNGESRCGEWDFGTLKNPLPPLTDTVLRAVQAARKTAENAINLRQVDEQVNKAVTAANRAATAARVAAVKAVQNRMDGKFCDIGV